MYFPMDYLIVFVLLALSALFSGLTLGLMGLNTHTLARQARLGNIYAQKILPLRTKGNQLLTTLILANVLVNTVLSVFLGSIASGIVAVGIATTLIFVLGDILPQAVFARHGLRFGAYWAPYTHALILILSPITYPIGWLLDYFLGEELPTIYSKQELMEIISEHEDSEHSPIDGDEERIVHGALQFSHKKASDVMTPQPLHYVKRWVLRHTRATPSSQTPLIRSLGYFTLKTYYLHRKMHSCVMCVTPPYSASNQTRYLIPYSPACSSVNYTWLLFPQMKILFWE
jgi:Cyclin M transmembrane N-terminal domain